MPVAACSAARTSVVLPVPASPTSTVSPGARSRPYRRCVSASRCCVVKEQEPRVRRQVERPLAQPVVLLVHGYLNSLQATAAHAASARWHAAADGQPPAQRAARRRRIAHQRNRRQHRQVRAPPARRPRMRSVRSKILRGGRQRRRRRRAPPAIADAGRAAADRDWTAVSGSRAGSRILNCSPICRRSRFAEICDSSFFGSRRW